MSRQFRLHSRQLFLTWPKCSLSKENVLEILMTKLDIVKYIIAEELHENGDSHIHAYIKCEKPTDITNPHKLDIEGIHGKYESCRNFHAVRNYCKKDNNYISNIDDFHPLDHAQRVINAESYDKAMEIVKTTPLARDYLRDTAKYESSIARIHQTYTVATLRYRFKALQSVVRWKRSKHSLWLYGPTGLGKTEFAKSLFSKPLFVTHIDKLKFLSKEHDGIIFDDMNFANWPDDLQIHIVDIQNDRDINVKHGMVTIPKGTPKVFTSNVRIFHLSPAVRRRLRLVKITEDIRLLTEELDPDSDSSSNSLPPEFEDFL